MERGELMGGEECTFQRGRETSVRLEVEAVNKEEKTGGGSSDGESSVE